MSIYTKAFLAIFFAIKDFGHIFWGTPRLVIILTDYKSVTQCFQTKINPATLVKACDYVIQFSFTFADIPGKNNTAADYLSFNYPHNYQLERGKLLRCRFTDPKVLGYSQIPLMVRGCLLEYFGVSQSAEVTLRKPLKSTLFTGFKNPLVKMLLRLLTKNYFT